VSGLFAPPQASTIAGQVDALVLFMVIGSALISLTIFACIVFFAIRYRRRPGNELAGRVTRTLPIEIAWTIVPLVVAMIPFVWGAKLYVDSAQSPVDAQEVYVVAKQWMWKAEHPEGRSEINALHVAVGRPVKLTMTSQDVIHSFFVPAFRLKADVLPGRYTTLWFQPTEVGEYQLLCAEYCGTAHSRMLGEVVVMSTTDYADWLTPGATLTNPAAAQGRQLFQQFGCIACHETGIGPDLHGVFGQPVTLSDGSTVTADENYVRESMLQPSAKIVLGFQPIMPSFAGRLSDDQIMQIIEYIKSLQSSP
jgi:cytochrome c oxidase subunit II